MKSGSHNTLYQVLQLKLVQEWLISRKLVLSRERWFIRSSGLQASISTRYLSEMFLRSKMVSWETESSFTMCTWKTQLQNCLLNRALTWHMKHACSNPCSSWLRRNIDAGEYWNCLLYIEYIVTYIYSNFFIYILILHIYIVTLYKYRLYVK